MKLCHYERKNNLYSYGFRAEGNPQVSIGNPEGKTWASGKEMVHFGGLRLQLGLIPLLSGEIYI
jgi:hypothetical protein